MNFRNLTNTEIEQLKSHLCTCDEWSNIFVKEDFNPETIYNTHFSGIIQIGSQTKLIKLYGGIKRKAGIYNSTLHNCSIGDNCFINYVKNHISNFNISDNVIINNVQLIANDGTSHFGNAQKIAVLDESGGREIMMYDNLSAQMAYIMTLYRHRPELIHRLEILMIQHANKKAYKRGYIGENTTITNSGSIKNCWIGNHVNIEGARLIENGSIISKIDAPVKIGNDVILKDFIIQSGTSVVEGVIISKCYIGQGCELGKGYSADNSVFFANCQGFHGEACSIFAGPFTVTHHKSTLLISGMFSFLNAGSGSNQSNHMYKLGPIHQGIVERGSKTTSDSYILWPAKIGPFTLVMGRHHKNSDTSNMPFSYLIESSDKSWLAPGVNLRSVGTIRDAMKWPKRDKRIDKYKIDSINFNLLSPFTIQKMIKGIEHLNNLKKTSGEASNEYLYNNTSISDSALKKGIFLYNIGIDKFLGNSVITHINGQNFSSLSELRQHFKARSSIGTGEWIDLAGMIAPKDLINNLLNNIESGEINNLEQIEKEFRAIHESYYQIEWNWSSGLLEKRLNKTIDEITPEDIINVIERWKSCVVELDKLLYEDARKEFQLSSMTGYGSDGDSKTQIADFEMVRGKFETNSFVSEILSHIERKSQLGDRAIKQIKDCVEKWSTH